MEVTPIIFEKDGFIYDNTFYTYSSINYIAPVKRHVYDDWMDERFGCCTKDDARAYIAYCFNICFNNGTKLQVGDSFSINFYIKCQPKIKNKFFKWLFSVRYIKNPELDNFIGKETAEMIEYKNTLTQLRETLLNKFK